jgi:hypothetical protein
LVRCVMAASHGALTMLSRVRRVDGVRSGVQQPRQACTDATSRLGDDELHNRKCRCGGRALLPRCSRGGRGTGRRAGERASRAVLRGRRAFSRWLRPRRWRRGGCCWRCAAPPRLARRCAPPLASHPHHQPQASVMVSTARHLYASARRTTLAAAST